MSRSDRSSEPNAGPVVVLKAGELVYREGEPAGTLFLIEQGEIHLFRALGEGGDQRLEKLLAGDFFGEQSLLADQTRGESAQVAVDATLIQLGPAGFEELVRRKSAIAARMLLNLSARLRRTLDTLANLEAGQTLPRSAALTSTKSGRRTGKHAAPAAASPAAPASAKPVTARIVHRDTATEFPLAPDRQLVVGRPDRASGTVPDVDLSRLDTERSLSRRHARVYRERDHWYILEETATRNGTYLNGRRIKTGEAARVKDGDRLRFGMLETTFQES